METVVAFDNSYARLPDRFYAKLKPKPVREPSLIALNSDLAVELGIDPTLLQSQQGIAALAGNEILDGSEPLAMAYAGQQFGNWSPQLGDGRALLLGEVIGRDGIRKDIQLKGSGPTPFSRMGDGRAWLGPVLREYIVSEAMAAMGVPTTRALAAVLTGEQIAREQVLPGAILTRVATSHLRVGTFQYFAARRDEEALKQLSDYAIDRLYPSAKESDDPYLAFLNGVIQAQAELVAKWMGYGFIHGVMNTDNVSIAGETIDYGPCAFMDGFHPDRVFSSIDEGARYAYSNQPRIAHWNMVQFAQAILPLLDEDGEKAVEKAQSAIDVYPEIFQNNYLKVFNAKLGLSEVEEGDEELINRLLKLMADQEADFTTTFRHLAKGEHDKFLASVDQQQGQAWLDDLAKRQAMEQTTKDDRHKLMQSSNPAYIPRNHRIEQAIRAALEGDYSQFERLNAVLAHPFEDQPGADDLTLPPQPKEIVQATFCGT